VHLVKKAPLRFERDGEVDITGWRGLPTALRVSSVTKRSIVAKPTLHEAERAYHE